MPMDIDIYGAAASYLDSKIVSGFSVNTVVEFPQPEQSHAVYMAWVGFVLRSPRVSAICRFFPWVLTKMQAARHDWAN